MYKQTKRRDRLERKEKETLEKMNKKEKAAGVGWWKQEEPLRAILAERLRRTVRGCSGERWASGEARQRDATGQKGR